LKFVALLTSLLLHAALFVGAAKVSWRFTNDDEQIAFAISFRSRSAPASDDLEGLDPQAPVVPPAPATESLPPDAPIVPLPLAPPPPEPLPLVPLALEPTMSDVVPVDAQPTVAKDEPPPAPELPLSGPSAAVDTLHATSDVPAAVPTVDAERREGGPIAGATPKADDAATATDAAATAAPAPAGAVPPHAVPPPRPGEVAADTNVVGEAATDYAPAPVYSARAIDLKLEGTVTLLAEVSADGHVESCEIETSSGHDLLDKAARKALRKWRFKPRRTNGVAHPFTARVPIDFHLTPRN
jgi:protein TonB